FLILLICRQKFMPMKAWRKCYFSNRMSLAKHHTQTVVVNTWGKQGLPCRAPKFFSPKAKRRTMLRRFCLHGICCFKMSAGSFHRCFCHHLVSFLPKRNYVLAKTT